VARKYPNDYDAAAKEGLAAQEDVAMAIIEDRHDRPQPLFSFDPRVPIGG
jgi:hypothetical protein